MARSASSTGFSVKCCIACGVTFFTAHRSVAVVTPGEKTQDEIGAYVAGLAANNTKRLPGADPSERFDVAASDDEVLDEVESLLE